MLADFIKNTCSRFRCQLEAIVAANGGHMEDWVLNMSFEFGIIENRKQDWTSTLSQVERFFILWDFRDYFRQLLFVLLHSNPFCLFLQWLKPGNDLIGHGSDPNDSTVHYRLSSMYIAKNNHSSHTEFCYDNNSCTWVVAELSVRRMVVFGYIQYILLKR